MRIMRLRHLQTFFAVIAVFLTPAALHGQGCALCYQSAAASGTHFIQALRSGISILILAPVVVCTGIAILAYRKRSISVND
jgi:hypothetical protein